jgi:hypothetical protein
MFTISQAFTDTFGYLFANRVAPLGIRLDYWQPGDLELTRVDVVSGFSSLPTVFLRVVTDSQSAFQNWGEHFTFSLSQVFSNCRTCFPWAAVMYFVSCFFTFGVPLPHVYEPFVLSFVLCFLFVLVSRFCCRSCFSKNVFFSKMSFHLVFLTNLMVLMVLMMLSTRRSSRYHAIRRFWLGSSGSWSGPLQNFCSSDEIWLTLVMSWQSSRSSSPWSISSLCAVAGLLVVVGGGVQEVMRQIEFGVKLYLLLHVAVVNRN